MNTKVNKPQEIADAKNKKEAQGKSFGMVKAYIDGHSMEDKHDEDLNQSTSLKDTKTSSIDWVRSLKRNRSE